MFEVEEIVGLLKWLCQILNFHIPLKLSRISNIPLDILNMHICNLSSVYYFIKF